jgi:predicted esterase YcpF (UPF0227 family)
MNRTSRTTHLLYLHGFRSSPQSMKAQKMAQWVHQLHPTVHWWCPQLPPSPQAAIDLVMQGTAHWPLRQTAVVGSSLGGFYAQCFAATTGCPALLLNPAVEPARDLAHHVGFQQAWHDPAQSFFFQPEYVQELSVLQKTMQKPTASIFAIVAKGDEVLSWREMTDHLPHAQIKLLAGSDHALSDFDDHQQDILDFLNLA